MGQSVPPRPRPWRSARGSIHTWGDGKSWVLWVGFPTARHWCFAKERLAFCTVTQDGDREGCLRLHELPAPEQAEVIREGLRIRKRVRVKLSEDEKARRGD